MSVQSLQAFRSKVGGSEQLQAAVQACAMNLDAITALGKQHGFEFTSDELQATISNPDDEITDFELDLVNAGSAVDCGGSTMTRG